MNPAGKNICFHLLDARCTIVSSEKIVHDVFSSKAGIEMHGFLDFHWPAFADSNTSLHSISSPRLVDLVWSS